VKIDLGSFQEQWRNLDPKVRTLAMVGGVLIFILLVYFKLWQPLTRDVLQLTDSVPKAKDQLTLMRAQVVQARQLRARGPMTKPTGNLVQFVQQSVQGETLRDKLKQFQADGSNGVRLQADKVEFNELLKWLNELNQSGIRVENAQIEAQAVSGFVSGKIVLRAPAS
jgi:type II secretory pathway component PulM